MTVLQIFALSLLCAIAGCSDAPRCTEEQAKKAGEAFATCIQQKNGPWQCGPAAVKIHCGAP